MKNKVIIRLLGVMVVLSACLNIYQGEKISRYRDDLAYTTKNNLEQFVAKCENSSIDTLLYAGMYGNIKTAHNSYALLNEGKGIPSEDTYSDLAFLLQDISVLMNYDKALFEETFSKPEIVALMLKISNDFEDKESIIRVHDEVEIQLDKLR